ncbi:hypothetical protein EON67_06920, partial [archaeon]
MQTSACSGPCAAGYYCPAGSTSSTAFQCGDVSVYCPAGSSAPVTVPNGYYSTPLAASPKLRSTITQCPPVRLAYFVLVLLLAFAPAPPAPAPCSPSRTAFAPPLLYRVRV